MSGSGTSSWPLGRLVCQPRGHCGLGRDRILLHRCSVGSGKFWICMPRKSTTDDSRPPRLQCSDPERRKFRLLGHHSSGQLAAAAVGNRHSSSRSPSRADGRMHNIGRGSSHRTSEEENPMFICIIISPGEMFCRGVEARGGHLNTSDSSGTHRWLRCIFQLCCVGKSIGCMGWCGRCGGWCGCCGG